jgi:amidase
MARSAQDAAALLAVVAGHDPEDLTSLPDPVPDYNSAGDILGLRIGIDARWNSDDVDESVGEVVSAAAHVFTKLGAILVEVAVPNVSQSIVDWSTLCAVEAALAHEQTFPVRKDEYGPVLRSVLENGHATSAIEFQKYVQRRMELRARFAELFADIDVLLAPAQAFAPLSLKTIQTLGEQPELILKLQRFTAPFDMTGDPTITLPGGLNEGGLPIAFQLIAGRLGELRLVQVARAFQSATNWHQMHPYQEILPS